MNHNTLRKYTDIVMFLAMCFLVGTGLMMQYRLLPGYRGGHGLTLLGLSRHEWGFYHLWSAYLLIAMVVVHVVLNFAFVKNVVASKRNWILAVLGLVGLAILLVFLIVPIERTEGEVHGGEHGAEHGEVHGEVHGGEHGEGRGRGQGEGRGGGYGEGRGRGQGQGRGQGHGRGRIDFE